MAGVYQHWMALPVLLLAALAWFSGVHRSALVRRLLGRTDDKLRHFATHDALTRLPNRVLLQERIQHAIHVSRRSGKAFAVLFMDLDGFKAINDTLGHAVGDNLLVAVAQRIEQCIRSEDMVARLGGDEFVVVIGNLASADVIGNAAENILQALRKDVDIDGAALRITSSIGIAVYPNSGETVDVLLKNADAAMYEAKQNGRNTYRFFEHAMHASAMRHLQIRHALQAAPDGGQFCVHFQPRFACPSSENARALTGVEALLRWDHPELGSMGPTEFIPIAERSNQIHSLGSWVLGQVCTQIALWDAAGMAPVKVSVNLSPLQLRGDLARDVLAIVSAAGIAPHRIMFEITEAAAMKNIERSTRVIGELQACGFDIAIDDFGAGFSSLAHLHKFGCKQIKIDSFFITRLGHGESSRMIVAAMIALAHALGVEVVAEGVETMEQLEILTRLKCDHIQGFLLARPDSAAALHDVMTANSVSWTDALAGGLPGAVLAADRPAG